MKKLLICLLLFCSLSIPSFAASWYWISQSHGINSWIDNDSVIKNQYSAEVWTKLVYPDRHAQVCKVLLTRNPPAIYVKETVRYDSYGNYQYRRTYPQKWEDIIPGTIGERLYKLIW